MFPYLLYHLDINTIQYHMLTSVWSCLQICALTLSASRNKRMKKEGKRGKSLPLPDRTEICNQLALHHRTHNGTSAAHATTSYYQLSARVTRGVLLLTLIPMHVDGRAFTHGHCVHGCTCTEARVTTYIVCDERVDVRQ